MGNYIKELYYITHIKNLPSILENGILSHLLIKEQKIDFTPIYEEEIVSKRRDKKVPGTDSTLWDYANTYFQPRNPMMYRVIHEQTVNKIAVIALNRNIMNINGTFVTDGNATSGNTIFKPSKKMKEIFPKICENIQREWWSEEDGSKRTIMAECLVPERISPENILAIYLPNIDVCEEVKCMINKDIPVIPYPDTFFQPIRKIYLANKLFLVEGDMFFSKLQTLTISVNCLGVMGKGLASRAKYQFPHVYVAYQDLCKQKKISLGKPYLYKQELSLDTQLADEPLTMKNGVTQTWFLLFATKGDWKKRADIKAIENGVIWICDNYKKEGITSLALPALGCGLGWLDWSQVGPILCSNLVNIDIPVWIYLPAEKKIPDDLLIRKFLLGK
jgi:O-acetyl-ADP-ribose deacetylase (regulator of RNase III)